MNNVKNLEHMLFNWVRLVVLLVRSVVGKWEQVILSLSEEVFFPSNHCEHLFFLTLFWKLSESEIISLLFSSEKKSGNDTEIW